MQINLNRTIRLALVCIFFSLYGLTLLTTTSLGGAPTPNPIATQSEAVADLTSQVNNLQSLTDYYKNQTQYYQNLYENESVNTSNKNVNDIRNNIVTINQNILQVYQNIETIQNNIFNLQIMVGITFAITLFGSLNEFKIYINKKNKK
jgi:hypothetical protein